MAMTPKPSPMTRAECMLCRHTFTVEMDTDSDTVDMSCPGCWHDARLVRASMVADMVSHVIVEGLNWGEHAPPQA